MSEPKGFVKEIREKLTLIEDVLHIIKVNNEDYLDLNEIKIITESISHWATKKMGVIIID